MELSVHDVASVRLTKGDHADCQSGKNQERESVEHLHLDISLIARRQVNNINESK